MRPGVPEFPQAHCLRVWVDLERRGVKGGVGEGWGGWRGGEEEEEEERVEVNDISLSLLVVYLFIYLLISFPFLSRRNNPCVPLQMKSPSTPRIPECICTYIRNTIFHLLPTTTNYLSSSSPEKTTTKNKQQ